jgi:hypothetical protein
LLAISACFEYAQEINVLPKEEKEMALNMNKNDINKRSALTL